MDNHKIISTGMDVALASGVNRFGSISAEAVLTKRFFKERIKMNKQWKLTAGAAALAMSFGAQAGTVDLFTTEQLLAKDYTNGSFTAADSIYSQAGGAADTTILGGYRDLVVSNLTGGVNNVAGSSINVTGGQLYFSTDTSATGQAQIQWDGNDAGSVFDIATSGLGGLDLTMGGSLSAFELTTIFSDQGWTFEITMYSSATNWTTVSLDATSVGTGQPGSQTSPHISYIPFSAFTTDALCGTYGAAPGVNKITCGGTGADATSIGALVATLNVGDPFAPNGTGSAPQGRTIAVDLQLDSVRTVPEPGVLALMGMGLMAAGFASRRRKSQA
jgi:hypothetical protein